MTEILLTLALITTLVLSYLERKDLYNRLMARNLRDFKDNTEVEEPNYFEEDDELQTLEEARDIIEEQLNG